MNTPTNETYRDWTITVTPGKNMCSNFSFDITSPCGHSQHVAMGGDNERRAMERAREMIDMERAMDASESN
ncbi:MAG: hypothetical protein LBD10_08760 [Desulfobulbus sp.]|uniref:hypothetical protein n=1 Tax=Desulfobulbus sp. TaxID=895 RepID=UPI002846FDFF|nr:hypothetical protein [Desulfobulbus sp.]MDR2550271.1 hypothetical protein [Desulfobulbus sp.]